MTGETGTGKELIARAVHNFSKRKVRALIKVNWAALPSAWIESELFGHVKTRWVIDGPKGAAKILNLHPNTLRSRIQKLGIK